MGKVPLKVWIISSLLLIGGALCARLYFSSNDAAALRFSPSPRAARRPAVVARTGQRRPAEYTPERQKGGIQLQDRVSDQAARVRAGGVVRGKGGGAGLPVLKQQLPNTILIGVKKGGTRALIEMLALHPNVRSSGQEVHFFDRDYNYENGLEWYKSRMKPSLPGDIVIEKSPAYFVVQEVPERMRADLGDKIKLLLVLRDPVSRVVSDFMQGQHHQMGKMVRVADLSPPQLAAMQRRLEAKVLKADGAVNPSASFIKVGLYAQHLERWLHHFARQQIFITSTNTLVTDPAAVLKQASAFLGLSPFNWDKHIVRVPGVKLPCLSRVKESTGRPELVCLNATKGREHIPLPDALRRKLADFFRPQNALLFSLIGKTFDSWRHDDDQQQVAGGMPEQLDVQLKATDLSSPQQPQQQQWNPEQAKQGKRKTPAALTPVDQEQNEQDPLW
ncbi:heparan sulfate glucosamine 3-O-sulfotransferase 6-like [Sycon ciliatum]|uniref:heparan sulfate glucosamine 3-O-sulfotransferase 6-like n=1 Tax=Sycon ciliatum TaxID=27933 RepID=UPI0031F62438